MSTDTKNSLLDALLIRYVKERTETEKVTTTLSSQPANQDVVPMLWLQFHGQAFAFRKDELQRIPYIAARLERWDGKLGLGAHKANPLPMTLMSLDRFLRAYNCIVHGLAMDVDYRDDLLALGIHNNDIPKIPAPHVATIPTADEGPEGGNSGGGLTAMAAHGYMDRLFQNGMWSVGRSQCLYAPPNEKWPNQLVSMCTQEVAITQTSFDTTSIYSIHRNGDLLSAMTLHVTLPALPKGLEWDVNLTRKLLTQITLQGCGVDGGPPIELYTLCGEMNACLAHVYGLTPGAHARYAKYNDTERQRRCETSWSFTLPLMVPPTQQTHFALPLVTLPRTDIQLCLTVRALSALVHVNATLTTMPKEALLQEVNSDAFNMGVHGEYVYLDTEARRALAQLKFGRIPTPFHFARHEPGAEIALIDQIAVAEPGNDDANPEPEGVPVNDDAIPEPEGVGEYIAGVAPGRVEGGRYVLRNQPTTRAPEDVEDHVIGPEPGEVIEEPDWERGVYHRVNPPTIRMARLWPMLRSLSVGSPPVSTTLWQIDLPFGGCCMGLVLAFRSDMTPLDSDASFHPFQTCELRLNGNIYANETADRMRFWNWQRQGLKPPKREKWYLLPFSPRMFATTPHTTLNLSRIDNVQLRLKMHPEAAKFQWHVEVAAPSFGFYVINQHGILSRPDRL